MSHAVDLLHFFFLRPREEEPPKVPTVETPGSQHAVEVRPGMPRGNGMVAAQMVTIRLRTASSHIPLGIARGRRTGRVVC